MCNAHRMQFFVMVGVVQRNESGVGSRGWAISQDKKTYTTWHGGIEVETDPQGRQTEFFWRGTPKEKEHSCDSVEQATQEVEERIFKKLNVPHNPGDTNYTRLPDGIEIQPARS